MNMNKPLLMTSALLFAGVLGIAFSQTGTSTPAVSATPAASTTPAAETTPDKVKAGHPLANDIRARIESQNERLQNPATDQKLTGEEVAALQSTLYSIRAELVSDLKTNGAKELTQDQYAKLELELDDNAKAIKGIAEDSAATPGTK